MAFLKAVTRSCRLSITNISCIGMTIIYYYPITTTGLNTLITLSHFVQPFTTDALRRPQAPEGALPSSEQTLREI